MSNTFFQGGEKISRGSKAPPSYGADSHIRSLSGLFTVVFLKEGKRHPQGISCVNIRNTKIVLSTHIIFSEPHHNSVLCLQRGPQ